MPGWLLQELGIHSTDQFIGVHGADFEDIPRSRRLQGAHTVVQGRVCTDCNLEWMSDLENKANPLLRAMQKLEQVRLSKDDCVLLATWIFKTLTLYSVTTNYRKIVPDSVFGYVRLNLMPPPGNHVEIAYAPNAPKVNLRTRLSPIKLAMFDKNQCDSAYINSQLQQSYVLCAQMSHLLERFQSYCRPYPQCENQAKAFSAVTATRASAMARSRASTVRALAERSHCLIFDQACSMGLKSGE